MPKDREQVPISFNMNDPIEKEIFNWLQKMKGETNKKGNVSAIVKKILFNYIDREKERESIKNELFLLNLKDGELELKMRDTNQVKQEQNSTYAEKHEEYEDTDIDADSLPF